MRWALPALQDALGRAPHQPHRLHAADRHWPETSCYTDLWIELLASLGLEPVSGLGFCASQDFEGDQFTFLKYRNEDLETLYGLVVQELAIYRPLRVHVAEQVALGRVVLAEVDAFWLPDTEGVSYRSTHSKTTIAIAAIDAEAPSIGYFHNRGFYFLDGADCRGLFDAAGRALPPYVEFVKPAFAPLRGAALAEAARAMLRDHLRRAPRDNPVRRFAAKLDCEMHELLAGPVEAFHLWAFNVVRQLGANFELLGAHLRWLGTHPATVASTCDDMAVAAKSLQFQIARAVARRRLPDLSAGLEMLAGLHDTVLTELGRPGEPDEAAARQRRVMPAIM
jgi:hypothetical protein